MVAVIKQETRKEVGVHEAKTQLSRLIAEALEGREVVICRNGKPMVRLEPIKHRGMRLGELRGCMKGRGVLREGWDDPMNEEELAEWYEGDI